MSLPSPSALHADLTLLATLPSSTLARLIDPTHAPAPPAAPPRAQLAEYTPQGGAEASLALSRAYVTEMRGAADELAPCVIAMEDRVGARIERIRGVAEVVRGAVVGYEGAVGVGASGEGGEAGETGTERGGAGGNGEAGAEGEVAASSGQSVGH